MAKVKRHRTLVNPARRRNKPRRKLSAKQKKYFGTKRQRAAVSRHAKRSAPKSNPKRRSKPRSKPRATRQHEQKNPGGEIITLALGNPAPSKRSKKDSMARHRKSKKSGRRRPSSVARRPRKQNPARRGHRRRRNPGFNVGQAGGYIKKAGFLIAGAAGTRLLTQAVLGSKNTGVIGYIANAIVALILGPVTGKVLKSPDAGAMVTLGGFVGLTLRLITDFTPFGQQLALSGMGDYQVSTFFTPARYIDATNSAVVDLPASVQPRLPAAPAAMSGLYQVGTYDMENSTY